MSEHPKDPFASLRTRPENTVRPFDRTTSKATVIRPFDLTVPTPAPATPPASESTPEAP